MLIDDTQPEETRVVIVNGNRIEDVEFESTSRKQIKGNIYLAKVMRVEPSLQAAFVDYGGNRHGFLAFGEIHPDYYNIPDETIAEVEKEVDEIIEAKKNALKEREAERERIRAEKARRREERLKAMAEAEAKAQAEAQEAAQKAEADNEAQQNENEASNIDNTVNNEDASNIKPENNVQPMAIPGMPFLRPKETPENAVAAAVETVMSESVPASTNNEQQEIPYNVMADCIAPKADTEESASDQAQDISKEEVKEEKNAPRKRVRRKRFNAKDETLKVLANDSEADEVVKADAGEEDDASAPNAETENPETPAPKFEINNDDELSGGNENEPSDDDDDDDIENDFELQRKLLKARKLYHRSAIQDVIKEGQVLLVQVVKEERGNKGAAMTTYLSLAGRYCVLMPNRIKSGGVSRKITNASDRKRLKAIVKELPLTMDMSMIVRTAGEDKTKADIVRDYNYLIRTWNNIRLAALKNKAPALIHEEGNLIKRALRDMFSKDTSEVIVDGESSYRAARDFIKMLAPQNLKKIKLNRKGELPLFQRFQVEAQLDKLHDTNVQLESGGYLVINPTEALVSIDVNSGRATKEKDLEETALKTNLEACDEIARQLRLRNLAGLVVVDFIDMEDPANNHAVEKRMKEALKKDRSRIQVAKMSCFGLLEISRQRMHSSFMESNYQVCPYCHGQGMVRTLESSTVFVLRGIEEEGIRNRSSQINVYVPSNVAIHLLNHKRQTLLNLEQKYKMSIIICADDSILNITDYRIEKVKGIVKEEAAMTKAVVENIDDTSWEEQEDNNEPEVDVSDDNSGEENNSRRDRRINRRRDRRNRRGRDRRRNNNDYDNKENTEGKKQEAVILYDSHDDAKASGGESDNQETPQKKTAWWKKLIKS